MLEKYKQWLKDIARKSDGSKYSESTVYKYTSSINTIKLEFGIDFFNYKNLDELFKMKNKLFSLKSFIEKDHRGNRMYSRAVEMFTSFICEKTITEISEDINIIERDKTLTYEEKNSYIETICNIRNPQFQLNFRNELIEEFNCKCALCGINDKRLLIASHIIPYSECINKSDMYKSYNGLLLCPIHDSLFDKHLISFDGKGKICIKEDIDKKIYDFLSINSNMILDNNILSLERKECLKNIWRHTKI